MQWACGRQLWPARARTHAVASARSRALWLPAGAARPRRWSTWRCYEWSSTRSVVDQRLVMPARYRIGAGVLRARDAEAVGGHGRGPRARVRTPKQRTLYLYCRGCIAVSRGFYGPAPTPSLLVLGRTRKSVQVLRAMEKGLFAAARSATSLDQWPGWCRRVKRRACPPDLPSTGDRAGSFLTFRIWMPAGAAAMPVSGRAPVGPRSGCRLLLACPRSRTSISARVSPFSSIWPTNSDVVANVVQPAPAA